MIKTLKKEARRYPRKGMRQVSFLTGLGVLLCAFAAAICGCGSNEGPPLSRQEKKPTLASSAEPRVEEILPQARPGAAVPQARLLGRTDPGSILVIPPDGQGDLGLTLAEVKARVAATTPVDPELTPAIPPDRPGDPGLTLAEVKARAAAAQPMDPQLAPAIPPDESGAPGITLAEVEARAAAAQPTDSQLIPAIPPD